VAIPSDDNHLLAYSTDTTGYRQFALQIKDLRTGKLLPEKFERVDDVVWATDNKTLFFVTETKLPNVTTSFIATCSARPRRSGFFLNRTNYLIWAWSVRVTKPSSF